MEGRILKLEESLESANETIIQLMFRLDNMEEEHERIFMSSEKNAERAYVMRVNYSTMEKNIKLLLKSTKKNETNMLELEKQIFVILVVPLVLYSAVCLVIYMFP